MRAHPSGSKHGQVSAGPRQNHDSLVVCSFQRPLSPPPVCSRDRAFLIVPPCRRSSHQSTFYEIRARRTCRSSSITFSFPSLLRGKKKKKEPQSPIAHMIIRILIEININMTQVTTGLLTLLMVFILVMQGNLSRSIPEEGDNNITNDFECHTDNDCAETNSFCNSNLNLCSQCLNCEIYFRTPKKNIQCPKDVSDCSACLNGYFEEIFFGGEIRDTCVPNVLPTPAKISLHSYWENYGIIFVVVNGSLFLVISLLWSYFYRRMRNMSSIVTSNALQNNPDNQLPSYNSCMKLDNFVTDDVQEFHLFTGEQPPRNEWRHQNAVPFRLPKVEPIDETEGNEDENIEEVDGTVQRVFEIEDPELHDEETMPSSWCPFPITPQSPEMSTVQVQNDNLENCQPPFKRIRLIHQSDDEKNQDEDNTSDMSQDDF